MAGSGCDSEGNLEDALFGSHLTGTSRSDAPACVPQGTAAGRAVAAFCHSEPALCIGSLAQAAFGISPLVGPLPKLKTRFRIDLHNGKYEQKQVVRNDKVGVYL